MAHVRPNHRFTHRPFHHGLQPLPSGDARELHELPAKGVAFVPKHRKHKKNHVPKPPEAPKHMQHKKHKKEHKPKPPVMPKNHTANHRRKAK